MKHSKLYRLVEQGITLENFIEDAKIDVNWQDDNSSNIPINGDISSLNDENQIIQTVLKMKKSGKPITTDVVQDVYQKSKDLKSNKLETLAKAMSQYLQENKITGKYMKQQLLEYLVRECVKEVLNYKNRLNEEDTKGAPAPPGDGLGTGDQAEIPKDKIDSQTTQAEPSAKETPEAGPSGLKGLVLVNPKDKSRLQKINIQGKDDTSIKRELIKIGTSIAGSRIKVASNTINQVKNASRDPNSTTYLYFGKFDPASDETFIMADQNLNVAKDSSVPPTAITGTPVAQVNPVNYQAQPAAGEQYPQQPVAAAAVTEDVKLLRKAIKNVVNEILNRK